MSKEQKTDVVEQDTTNQPTADSKKQVTKKTSRMKSFVLYLIFMLLLAAGSAIAVYHTTPIVLKSLAPQKTFAIKTIPTAKAAPPVQDNIQPQDEPIFTNEIEPEISSAVEEEIISIEELPEPVMNVQSPVFVQPQPVISIEQQQTPNEATRSAPNYSVLKAIELKESFKNGGECRPLLEELVALPNKTPQMEQALMELVQACLDRPIAGQMQQAFHAIKKRAILRIYQNKYPIYIAYIKSLPYFIANIRKKNPTTDKPLDILDRIQNAVDEDRPHLVLQLIPMLPENVQATLNDVTQYAETETHLYKTLNTVIKAIFDGEER